MAKKAKKTKKAKKAKKTGGKTSRKSGRDVSSNDKLVIVESPAKARTINRYLGKDYTVKASMGHVRDLPKREIGVDIEHGFEPTYVTLSNRKKMLTQLRKQARSAEAVYLATDLDREGEAIAWHLTEALKLPPEKTRRVVFNEITSQAVRNAFAQPRGIDPSKVNAQQARRILDRIVGYQVSPLLWKKVATGLSAGRVQSVAVRLIVEREREIQDFTPEEYWKISSIFTTDLEGASQIARDWRQFMARLDDKGNPPTRDEQTEYLAGRSAFWAELMEFNNKPFKTDDAETAIEVARNLGLDVEQVDRSEDPEAKGPARNLVRVVGHPAENAPEYKLDEIDRKQRRSKPPAPFATATLQQSASVRLRYSASRTMRIAQQLYEGIDIPGRGSVGLITYMRTDSMNISAGAISGVRSLIEKTYGGDYLPGKPNYYTSARRAQEAHEAIRPTDVNLTPDDLRGALSSDQFKLYNLIWRRFVACQMTPARWEVTDAKITAETPGGPAVFRARGQRLVFDGFMRVAGVPKTKKQILPELKQGRCVEPVEINPQQNFTAPPPRYTEASLVKTLEAKGIGRPSTYASIIQTIQDRDYVRQEGRTFFPTDMGMFVNDKLVRHFPQIFDVGFTAHMEDQLDRVEEHQADWKEVLEEFYEPFSRNLDSARENMVHAKAESVPSEYTCETCGKKMVYKISKNGWYLACSGWPDCKQTNPVDEKGRKIERKEIDVACPQCGKKPMILRRSRYGPFLGCSDYPDCKGTVPCDKEGNPLKTVKAEDVEKTCEECGGKMTVKFKGRRAFMGCSNYPKCKNTEPLPEGVRVEPPPKKKPKPAGVNCPKCGKPMVIRTGKRGKFLACSGFPKCRNAMDVSKIDELKTQQTEKK